MRFTSPLNAIFNALLNWWWLIAISVAVSAGVGYFARSQQDDVFVSTVSVLIGQDARSATAETVLNANRDLADVYAVLVQRDAILQPVIDKLGMEMATSDLRSLMWVATIPEVGIMEISIFDTDPNRAAQIANAIGSELILQSPTNQVSENAAFVQNQLQELQNQITNLTDENNRLFTESEGLTSAFDLQQNLETRNANTAIIQDLRVTYASLSASLNNPANQLRIFEAAIANFTPVSSGSIVSVIIAGAIGAALSIVTIVLITFFDDRLQWTENQEEAMPGVRALGPLGLVPRSKLPLYIDTAPNSMEAEVLRQLRAKLVIASGGIHPKVVTFVSYDSGDGKTTTTANMALASAKLGLRTVVVDGDLRKGNQNEIFGVPNVVGLSNLLASNAPLEDMLSQVLLDSGYDNLAVIPCGRSGVDPAALLSTPRFTQLMTLLRRRFDVVCVDSVPVIGGPDGVFLAEAADGVVIVVDARRTRVAFLERIMNTLQQGKVNIFGVAYNRVRLEVTSSYSKPYGRVDRLDVTQMSMLRSGQTPTLATPEDPNAVFTMAEAAKKLGVKPETAERWRKQGVLKAERQNNRWTVSGAHLNEILKRFMYENEIAPLPEPASAPQSPFSDETPALTPDSLRNTREALLNYMREAAPAESSNGQSAADPARKTEAGS